MSESLEKTFYDACAEAGIKETDMQSIRSLLAPLRDKNEITHVHYLHSLRVALVARDIARFQHLDERALLFAGALHDIGKALVPSWVLGETGEWTAKHQDEISRHVMDGYRLLNGRFDFSAEVMLWHHRFQSNGYPQRLPKPLHGYGLPTKALIVEYGRMLAIADVYDALHRRNAKFGKVLTADEIRVKMLAFNPDRRALIVALYDAGILGGPHPCSVAA
jgi:response regulator RpfG family c-di-GMP phosphodiesterase